MKTTIHRILCLLPVGVILFMTGCEYDVAEPLWTQSQPETPVPEITSIDPPDVAVAGANTITITGVNFGESAETNDVYFGNVEAEILSASSTSITVRRPNLVVEACTVKVVPHHTLLPATHSPYGIDLVMDYYGTFLENTELSTAVVDQDENVYVFQRTSPVSLVKITPEGERIMLNEDVSSAATDAKIGPDGSMVVLVNNRQTSKINLETGEETDWLRLSKSVSRGDFDENGNLYAGGRRSDLIVILPDESFSQIGHWIADEILWVRVYDNYVYLLIDIASVSEERPDFSIWRHPIDGAGNVGEPELFIDWTQTGDYAESLPSCFTFSENGLMMIGTDHADPIMLYDLESDTQDILYKDILPTAAIQLVWGAGSHVYMILGGENNNLIRIDMGTAGAPYYGR